MSHLTLISSHSYTNMLSSFTFRSLAQPPAPWATHHCPLSPTLLSLPSARLLLKANTSNPHSPFLSTQEQALPIALAVRHQAVQVSRDRQDQEPLCQRLLQPPPVQSL